MIFGSLGLLIVAGSLLAAGIAKGSTGYLVVSLVCTAAAGALLLLAYSAARSAAAGSLAAGAPAVSPTGVWPAATPGNGGPAVVYVPVSQVPGALAGALPGQNGGNGGGHAGVLTGEAPILGYEEMTADQIGKLVTSGALNADQLLAVRSYEQAHGGRKTVLDRIDRALSSATR